MVRAENFLFHLPERELLFDRKRLDAAILLVEIRREHNFSEIMHQSRGEGGFRHGAVAGIVQHQLPGAPGHLRAVAPEAVNRKIDRLDLVVLAQELQGHHH